MCIQAKSNRIFKESVSGTCFNLPAVNSCKSVKLIQAKFLSSLSSFENKTVPNSMIYNAIVGNHTRFRKNKNKKKISAPYRFANSHFWENTNSDVLSKVSVSKCEHGKSNVLAVKNTTPAKIKLL